MARAWKRLYAPGPLLATGIILYWLSIWLIYSSEWVGFAVAILASFLMMISLRRLQTLAAVHERYLRSQLLDAAARNRNLARLQRVTSMLLAGESLDSLFQEIADAAATLLEAEGGVMSLVVEEGRFVRIVAASGAVASVLGRLIPVDQSLLGWSITHEEPVTCSDMAADRRSYHMEGVDVRSTAVVPLRSGGLVIGTLSVYNHVDGRPFDAADLSLLGALGDQAVVGLDRAHVLEESRRNEHALAVKNRELQRATELKSQFLANMSHELRTPLNAIIGFSDLILTEQVGPVNEPQRDFLDSVLRNGRHLLGLINSILDLSKIEAGRMTLSLGETDLREAILGAVADTSSLRAAKRQECRTEVDGDSLRVQADGTRIRQILFNLLANASKFTPEGGQVSISAVATRAPLPMPADRAGDRPRLIARDVVWVSISDTGMGIKPEDMPKLFQEFSQVDSSASRHQAGTGLGLALCRKFVEMHGGTIGAESIFGKGSSFWFILPVEGPVRRPAEMTETE